jgi:mannose-6-phosphate isomerase-like protein (cupin superfamily)
MSNYTLKSVEELETIHHGLVKLAGAELGLHAFGMQVLDLPSGFSDYPEHDHAGDGQEEVYLVLHGSAELHVDGEPVPVSAGHMIRVAPGARRTIMPGGEGARILALGAAADRPYERPEAFELEERA